MIAFRDEVEFSFFHLGRNPLLPSPTAYDRDRKNSFGVNASSLSFSLNFEIFVSSVLCGILKWNQSNRIAILRQNSKLEF